MAVIKILFILFYSVLIKNWSYALSTAYTGQSNNGMCACFDNTGQSVTENLGPDKNDLERLVIYLYRNIKTGQIHVYTPKREKQYNFPDLTVDVEDKLFETNSQIIIQLLNQSHSIEHGSNDKPLELNPQILHELSLKDESEKQLISEHIKKEIFIEQPETHESNVQIATNRVPLDSYKNYEETTQQSEQPEILPTQESHPRLIKDPTHKVPPAIEPFETLNEEAAYFDMLDEANKKYAHGKHIPSFDEDHIPMSEKIKPINYNNYDPMDYGIASEMNTPYYDNFGLHASEDRKYLDSQLSVFNNPIQYKSGSFVGNSQPDKTIIKAYSNSPGLFFTFDIWFDQQMRRINTTSKSSNKNIDLHSLKLLIEKTLYENRMYVTKDGVLIDTYGNVLNVANLKLLPILIGNSLPYKIILNVKNNRIELPTDVQFSQAILVTTVFPPKILGVIPLGTANVPQVSYRRRFNFWSTSTNTADNDVEPLYVVRKSKYKKKHHHKHHNKYNNAQSAKPGQPRTGSPKLKLLVPDRSFINDINTHLGTISSYQKLGGNVKDDKSVDYKNNQSVKNNYKALLKVYGQKPLEVAKDNEIEDISEEELPGFRIIGGAPATGSGTPVVSRGRSGAVHS